MRYVIGCGRMAAVGIMILVILFILLVLFPLVGRKGRGCCVRRGCRVRMRVRGVRMTVRGAVPVAQSAECGVNGEGPGYMVCANHVSFIDIFILVAVLPCRFVAKKEIASWPVFGFIARGTGTLFIDRSRKRAVLEIADAMAGAINEGANGSMGAIMNTACAVGFGSVVKVVPGFASLTSIALNMPGSILFSEAVAVNLLAGATGSASGGMSIALSALGPKYAEMAAGNTGVLEALHRIASISSGGLDTLPHNGAVLTLLAVSNCTHKESYIDICITTCIIPLVSSLGLALIWGLFL